MNTAAEGAGNGTGDGKLEMARARAGLYGLLSRVFSGNPTAGLVKGMKEPGMQESLASFEVPFDEEFLAGDDEQQAEDLAIEYARLFLATESHIAPYESVFVRGWAEDKPQLWGEATVEVSRFYQEAGLELREGQTPDHLGIELEAMAVMAECEAARRESGDAAGAARLEELQHRFCEEHLKLWVPEFCEEVLRRTESGFYRSMAVLTASLVRMHCGEETIID
ncbi:MAG: molecular chaperone TorD family protein [Actinobacteria bacterium]|nr:molecular chaperone TorD family protein [Actinomycetota bacterium]